MRQYELAIRIAQIHHLIDERKYKKALTVVRALDMRQIKSLSDLSAIADVYAKTEQYDAAKATYLRIYRKSRTRRILYKLIYLAIRTNEIDEAEKYYQEFVNMNSNARDAIILRYRIDKAAGVPIGRLIETLEELKEEEYIEEWAYELAKMYHKAGRREECRRECEDILLWFGHGEIVERAKKLIEYVDDNEAMPYLDDKDFTIKDKEEPNPDDTGSLPDLNEYLQAKSQLDDYNKSGRYVKDSENKGNSEEDVKREEKKLENTLKDTKLAKDKKEFIDDYDEVDFDIDADLGRIAKEGLHKLSGFLRFGGKKDTSGPAEEEAATKKETNVPDEDIHTEVSADMKKNEIKSSKKTDSKSYDKSYAKNGNNSKDAKNGSNNKNSKINNNKQSGKKTVSVKVKRNKPEEKHIIPVYSQSGTGITQDLSREISAIYEAEHREQLKEKAVTVIRERKHAGKEAVSVIERMTNAVKNDESKNISPAGIEEIGMEDTKIIAVNKTDTAKGKKDVLGSILEADLAELQAKKAQEEAIAKSEEARIKAEEAQRIWEEAERKRAEAEAAISGNYNYKSNKEADKEINKEISKEISRETDIKAEEESKEIEVILPKGEEVTNDNIKEDEKVQEPDNNTKEEAEEEVNEAYKNEEETEEVSEAYNNGKEAEEVSESDNSNEEKTEEAGEAYKNDEEAEEVSEAYNNDEEETEEAAADNFEINELSDDDLPTTRALHTSFDDILTLIGGEPDPSHFVFVGNSSDLIVGLSKRIIKVMKETGYMSIGRIAKISAKKLNSMNINEFKSQLKGNCLLIDEAAELMVPTIASVFKMMDEFYGDFVVILADDGNTLDQLFRFAPALAKRFKYIIDISGYTENDC